MKIMKMKRSQKSTNQARRRHETSVGTIDSTVGNVKTQVETVFMVVKTQAGPVRWLRARRVSMVMRGRRVSSVEAAVSSQFVGGIFGKFSLSSPSPPLLFLTSHLLLSPPSPLFHSVLLVYYRYINYCNGSASIPLLQ